VGVNNPLGAHGQVLRLLHVLTVEEVRAIATALVVVVRGEIRGQNRPKPACDVTIDSGGVVIAIAA